MAKTKTGERPYVLLNMAMTADGKIATANRAISHFGSRRDAEHLYELRATADAVMCGARTLEAEGAQLGPGPARFRRLRLRRGLRECNLRVVVSGAGRIRPDAAIFRRKFSPVLVLASGRASLARRRRLAEVADAVAVFGRETLDFASALRWLRREWKVKRLLCEGGGELNRALFAQGLVDELHLTICPFVCGGARAPTIAEGPGRPALAGAANFQLVSRRRHGGELFLVFRRR